ncbi:hypothetical protein BBH88_07975 [Planococcus antarcticus DSM 14505]|uniref:Uncharacterized protein n=1 Tax=Planococcus antarcticus DSM 14505 TaxID=1185653 RepID=A0ABM6D3Z4_9BACL|nr:hypothetical protein BBH88_07975 [Planococcus antarcticus DSM 14505]
MTSIPRDGAANSRFCAETYSNRRQSLEAQINPLDRRKARPEPASNKTNFLWVKKIGVEMID